MKKTRIISLLLTIFLLVGLLSTGSYAAEPSAKTIVQAYKQVINSASFGKYAPDKVIDLYDLDGNTIPELFLWTEGSASNSSLVDIQIWTYQNGAAKKIGTVSWGMASAGYTLYVNASGNLVSYGGPSSVDFGHWLYVDTFSYDAAGKLYISEKVALTIQEVADPKPPRTYLNPPLVTGTLNGQPISEKEAGQLYEAKQQDYKNAQVRLLDYYSASQAHAMSKADALRFLECIDAFFDVPGDQYYAEPVKWAVENSITNGTGDYSFSPNETCTRGHILTFLWRAIGSPVVSIANPFNDITPNDYYYQAALWAYQNGMVSGNRFEPSTPCTRAATVTYIWQSKGSPYAEAATFSDVPTGVAYSQAVAWAVKNRITDGIGNNQFAPDTICSRGQIVTFLYRARNIANSIGTAEKPISNNSLDIEPTYIPLLQEIQSVILTGNDHGLSENAQAYISCKQMDNGQGGNIDTTLFALTDLDGDGTPELLLTGAEHNLDAIYTIKNGSATLIRFYAFAPSRHSASVYGIYIIENYMLSLNDFSVDINKLNAAKELTPLESFTISIGQDGARTYHSEKRGTISESDYFAVLSDYQTQPEPAWRSLKDLTL